MMELPLSP